MKALITFLVLLGSIKGFTQQPTYLLTARNDCLEDTLGGKDNMLKINIYLLWTNQGFSDTFYYGACQYCLTINPAVFGNTSTLLIKLTNSDLPPSLQPTPSTNKPTSQIRLAGNLPSPGFIVNPVFPGTKVAKLRITRSDSSSLASANYFGLLWRNSGTGLITKISYINNSGVSFITDSNHHVIDSTNSILECFLPVEISSFTSSINNNSVTLNWTTEMEENNSGFDIERSKINNEPSDNWIRIGNVIGNGTSNSQHNYFYTDKNLISGKYKYRVKQIDYNGNFEYFNLIEDVTIGIPVSMSLSQNYPNPFNPSTIINYTLNRNGFVKLKVYNIAGVEIKNLINESIVAGYYQSKFDGAGLSSGVYFYVLEVDGRVVDTKRMVLMK